ncbi:MAG TPA: nuclear transport factor 2 family protein [Thermoanaerobaculia bacterium]|nr:nuclear transport factor 2 family protein [Thermoanaerobaculia bacterium]
MLRACSLLAALCLLASCSAAPEYASNVHLTPGPAVTPQLIAEITAVDKVFFEALFTTCDLEILADTVTEDFEFYHDKSGLTNTSGEQFVNGIREACKRREEGTDFRARRELVAGSMKVYPLNNYGAIQVGVHRFYALEEGQPDKLTETSKFTTVWKNDGGKWRMARVLSYDHQLAR